jgi:microcompartment protein CcmL/EutN
MDSLGMLEVNSIAVGIEAGDAMLKTANVTLVTAQPVCPGKYIVLIQGDVAAVKSSVEAGKAVAKESLVDMLVIPSLHPQVFAALNGSSDIEKRDAVGVIETFSLATAIYVADASVKAAEVDLIEIRLGRGLGGKAFVLLTGDVSSVRAAVESGVKKHENEGTIAKTVVIPSPHPDIMKALL